MVHVLTPLSIGPGPSVICRNLLVCYYEGYLVVRLTIDLEAQLVSTVTAFSTYWQITCIYGGIILHSQIKDGSSCGDKGPTLKKNEKALQIHKQQTTLILLDTSN